MAGSTRIHTPDKQTLYPPSPTSPAGQRRARPLSRRRRTAPGSGNVDGRRHERESSGNCVVPRQSTAPSATAPTGSDESKHGEPDHDDHGTLQGTIRYWWALRRRGVVVRRSFREEEGLPTASAAADSGMGDSRQGVQHARLIGPDGDPGRTWSRALVCAILAPPRARSIRQPRGLSAYDLLHPDLARGRGRRGGQRLRPGHRGARAWANVHVAPGLGNALGSDARRRPQGAGIPLVVTACQQEQHGCACARRSSDIDLVAMAAPLTKRERPSGARRRAGSHPPPRLEHCRPTCRADPFRRAAHSMRSKQETEQLALPPAAPRLRSRT